MPIKIRTRIGCDKALPITTLVERIQLNILLQPVRRITRGVISLIEAVKKTVPVPSIIKAG